VDEVLQIELLVIRFGRVNRPSSHDFGDNRWRKPTRCLQHRLAGFGQTPLLGMVVDNSRAPPRTTVTDLLIDRDWINLAPGRVQQFGSADLRRSALCQR